MTDGKLQFRISKVSLLNSMSESDVAADVEISDAGTESLFPSGVYTWAQLSNADTTLLTSDNFGGVRWAASTIRCLPGFSRSR